MAADYAAVTGNLQLACIAATSQGGGTVARRPQSLQLSLAGVRRDAGECCNALQGLQWHVCGLRWWTAACWRDCRQHPVHWLVQGSVQARAFALGRTAVLMCIQLQVWRTKAELVLFHQLLEGDILLHFLGLCIGEGGLQGPGIELQAINVSGTHNWA